MIVDTSVIIALALGEPGQHRFLAAMAAAPARSMSTGTWIELSAVAVRCKITSIDWTERMMKEYFIVIVPLTVEQAQIGHVAYRTYGIGSGHRARLNLGDCFSYALAKSTGEPLLFKGDDFGHTDVRCAIEPD